jgi:hypothetical protein
MPKSKGTKIVTTIRRGLEFAEGINSGQVDPYDVAGDVADAAVTAGTSEVLGPLAPLAGYFAKKYVDWIEPKPGDIGGILSNSNQFSPDTTSKKPIMPSYLNENDSMIAMKGPGSNFIGPSIPYNIQTLLSSLTIPWAKIRSGSRSGAFSHPNTQFRPDLSVHIYPDTPRQSYASLKSNAAFGQTGFRLPPDYQQQRSYSSMTEFPIDETPMPRMQIAPKRTRRIRKYKGII